MTRIEFVKVVRTALYGPTQWDAWDAQGHYYFLRHRHGRGRIEGEHGHVHFTHELPDVDSNSALLVAFLDLANTAPGNQTEWTIRNGAQLVDYDYTLEEQQMTEALAHIPAPPPAPAPPAPGIQAPAPQPLFKGRVALFMAPDQSLVISYRRDGTDEQKQTVIPGMYLAMAASTVGSSPEQMLAKMLEM